MKKHLSLFTAAALVVGGMGLSQWAGAQDQSSDNRSTGQRMEDTAGQAGEKMKETGQDIQQGARQAGEEVTGSATQPHAGVAGAQVSPDAKEIRNDLTRIVQAALSNKPVDNLEDWFVKADRDRFAQAGGVGEYADLKGTVEAFKNDWKSKYNKDFDISRDNITAANYQILQGDLGEQARPAGGRITPQGGGQTTPGGGQYGQPGQGGTGGGMDHSGQSDQYQSGQTDQSGQSGQYGQTGAGGQMDQPTQRGTGQDSGQYGQTGTQTEGQPQAGTTDRNHATVVIPADPQHNLPQLTLHFVNEGTITDAWRLDIPDNITADQLKSNLKDHLFVLGQQKNAWPNDPNQAYQAAAHHIFAALQNVPVQGGGQQQMQGGQYQQGQTGQQR